MEMPQTAACVTEGDGSLLWRLAWDDKCHCSCKQRSQKGSTKDLSQVPICRRKRKASCRVRLPRDLQVCQSYCSEVKVCITHVTLTTNLSHCICLIHWSSLSWLKVGPLVCKIIDLLWTGLHRLSKNITFFNRGVCTRR